MDYQMLQIAVQNQITQTAMFFCIRHYTIEKFIVSGTH